MLFQFPSNRTYSTLFFCLCFFLNGSWWLQDQQQTSPWLKYMALQMREGKWHVCLCALLKIHPMWNVSPPPPSPLPWQSIAIWAWLAARTENQYCRLGKKTAPWLELTVRTADCLTCRSPRPPLWVLSLQVYIFFSREAKVSWDWRTF